MPPTPWDAAAPRSPACFAARWVHPSSRRTPAAPTSDTCVGQGHARRTCYSSCGGHGQLSRTRCGERALRWGRVRGCVKRKSPGVCSNIVGTRRPTHHFSDRSSARAPSTQRVATPVALRIPSAVSTHRVNGLVHTTEGAGTPREAHSLINRSPQATAWSRPLAVRGGSHGRPPSADCFCRATHVGSA